MKQLLGIATTLLLVISAPVLAEKPVTTGTVVQLADADTNTQSGQTNNAQDEKSGNSIKTSQEKAKTAKAEKTKKQHKVKKHHKAAKKAEHKKTVKKAKHVKKKVHAKKKIEARNSEKPKAKSGTTDSSEAPK